MNLALSITMIKMITQNGVDLKNDFQSFRVTGVLNKPMPHRLFKLFFRTGLNLICEGLLIFRCVTLLPELFFPDVQWFFHRRERFSTLAC